MKKITIFTPSYNRGDKLFRLYNSLKKQKFKNFEWILIDDGSTDNTKEVIKKFIKEGLVEIKYIYKENGGKQSCWNLALKISCGIYFIGVDSDDTISSNGLEEIKNFLKIIEDKDNIVGLRLGNIAMSTHKKSGGIIKNGIFSWKDEVFIWKNLGEKIDVFKTEIIKEYPYPVKKDIKFIPEIWLYSKLSSMKYKFYYSEYSLGRYWDIDFENDGDRLTLASYRKHLKGHILARREVVNNEVDVLIKNPKYYIKNLLRYIECCILDNEYVFKKIDNNLAKILIINFYIFGYVLSKTRIKNRSNV